MMKLRDLHRLASATALAGGLTIGAAAFAQDAQAPDIDTSPADSITQIDGAESTGFSIGNPLGGALLLALPLLLLIRTDPKKPKDVTVPSTMLLRRIYNEQKQPQTSPWIPRALAASAIIAGSVGTMDISYNPDVDFAQDGDVLLAVDNDFAAAPGWETRLQEMTNIISAAGEAGRQIIVLPCAADENGQAISPTPPMNAADALVYIRNMQAQPWTSVCNPSSLETLQDSGVGATYWLSSGIENGQSLDFAMELNNLAPLHIGYIAPENLPPLLHTPILENGTYTLNVSRIDAAEADIMLLLAHSDNGGIVAQQAVPFDMDQTLSSATISAVETNGLDWQDIAYFTLGQEQHAGAIALTDEPYKPRAAGIVVRDESDARNIRAEANFLRAALSANTDYYTGDVDTLLGNENISVLFLPDDVPISTQDREAILQWVESGGELVRFAGSNMAYQLREGTMTDPLIPHGLRLTSETIGTFESVNDDSALFNINIRPSLVARTSIALTPGPDSQARIWATLDNGNPLISAHDQGDGQIILFHSTANDLGAAQQVAGARDFVLSSNFIHILREIMINSRGGNTLSEDYTIAEMPAFLSIEADGTLGTPLQSVQQLTQDSWRAGQIDAGTPPGFYGDALNRIAVNLDAALPSYTAIDFDAIATQVDTITYESYAESQEKHNWKSLIFALAAASLIGLAAYKFRHTRNPSSQQAQNKKPQRDSRIEYPEIDA